MMENDLILVQLRQEKVRQWVNKYLRGEVLGGTRPKELEKYFSHSEMLAEYGQILLWYNLRKLSGIDMLDVGGMVAIRVDWDVE